MIFNRCTENRRIVDGEPGSDQYLQAIGQLRVVEVDVAAHRAILDQRLHARINAAGRLERATPEFPQPAQQLTNLLLQAPEYLQSCAGQLRQYPKPA